MGSLPAVNDEIVDVAIIGGGPTGLLSALLMRSLGTTVSILDSKPGPLQLGRADALNARTQQYLEVVGVLKELRAKGIECNTSSTFGDGEFKSRQSHWWTGLEHCLHKHFLMIGQPEVEATLLNRLDTPVHYGEEAASISEDEEGVTVVTTLGRTIRSKYAVGADGARSMVRNTLGISFTGTKPEMLWAVLDTFIDTDFPVCSEIITFQLNEQARVSWIPRERGMARFYVLLDGDVTQEKAEASIREHMSPHRVDFRKTEWFSTFEIKERIASTFVSKEGQGRILLAGDAAHVHSVNGGQGLNTGIADAFALAWRLSLAVDAYGHGSKAAGSLIQSYDIERRTVAADVINVAARLVRDTMHTAKQYVGTIEKNAGYITGMGVAYDECGSPLVTESQNGIWKAGRRCPDIILHSGSESRWLYSTVTYGQFSVLSCGRPLTEEWSHFEDISTRYTLLPASSKAADFPSSADGKTLTFVSEDIDPQEQFVVVARPDMYIGYVGTEKQAMEYLSRSVKGT
ncbi:hypothetical protein AC578_1326 [Pseudocercospora eumusae]|uniref:FAD-binding domain-containing protein n=1 Tax=Pseudocercospora eumusae TaxID=321146 RepID=A0A139HUI6_9PEZI|nr:hypothetical protein AC578_1326 [Pseudocercospora eumusae]